MLGLALSSLGKVLLSKPDVAVNVFIVIPRDLSEEITELLVREGVMEPQVLESGSLLVRELENYIALLEEAKRVYEYLESNLERRTVVKVKMIPESIRRTVENLLADLRKVYEEVSSLNNLIASYEKSLTSSLILKELSENLLRRYPNGTVSLIHYTGKYVAIRTLLVPEGSVDYVKNLALEVVTELRRDKDVVLTCVFSPERLPEVLNNLPEGSTVLEPEADPGTDLRSYIRDLELKLEELSRSVERLRSRRRDLLESKVKDLALLKAMVESEYERLKILKGAVRSRYTVTLSGWVLRSKLKHVLNALSRYPTYVVISESENPPVEFDNIKPFKPFELLTELYGVPTHYEWDPTPLLTYAFLFFYSLMMADVGYGIGVLLATRYILPKFVSDPDSPGFRRLQRILYVGGILSAVVGIVAKSFLGSLLGRYLPVERPLIDTINVVSMVGLCLAIGYSFTFISHSIALAKNVKLRNAFDAVFEAGILLVMVGGPFVISRFFGLAFLNVPEGIYRMMQALTIVGITMVILSRVKTIGGVGGFLWVFDVIGIAGDTLSYIRIAGIAGGTALLAELFNVLVAQTLNFFGNINLVIGAILGIITALVLHTVALALSAISPFVHSLRLCLFEIASKFYEGRGRRLKPIRIPLGKVVV